MATNVGSGDMSSKTLFVGNVPYSATDSELEHIFGDIGPLKHCFVVKDKSSGKGKGFGYVTFSVRVDAEKAKEQEFKIDGRKLLINFARKKVKNSKPKRTENVNTNIGVGDTKKSGENLIISPANSSRVNKKKQGDQKLTAEWKSKLIVRNLSFKCTNEDLHRAFKKFGKIKEVKIPKKADGKMLGFGFVHFTDMNFANIALHKMNGKEIKGRVVAVDWALPKVRYVSQQKGGEVHKDAIRSHDDNDSESDDGNNDAVKNDELEKEAKNKTLDSKTKKVRKSKVDDDDDDDDIEKENDDDEEDDDDDEEDGDDKEHSDDDFDTSDEDRDDMSIDSGDETMLKSNKNVKLKVKSDVGEGKTVFIRNLSFDTEEEDIENLFSEFGNITFCRLVTDSSTEHSKGMAFVKYVEKADADSCLEKARDESFSDKFYLDNRQLYVSRAVSREEADNLRKEKKEKQPKDNRNLFLVREGMIRPGTKEAEGLSKVDLDKRMKVEQMKRQKLKNPLVFVSPTRLCVRNIPATVSDNELRTLFRKAVSDNTAKITECRVMRDLNRVNSEGIGKSKGFAFVEFSDHKHALQALRKTNNDPSLFGENKRLIVEFSLENKAALQLKAKRLERIRTKQTRFGKDRVGEKPKVKTKQKDDKFPLQSAVPRTSGGTKLPKGLPSHWGPKVRHKPRPQSQQVNDAKKTKAPKRKSVKSSQSRSKRQRRSEKTDSFDSLVNKHKQRLMGAMSKKNELKNAKSKWFE